MFLYSRVEYSYYLVLYELVEYTYIQAIICIARVCIQYVILLKGSILARVCQDNGVRLVYVVFVWIISIMQSMDTRLVLCHIVLLPLVLAMHNMCS